MRPAGPSDINGIQSVATQAWHAAHAPIIGADTVETFLEEHYDTESFRSRINHKDVIIEVAADAGDTVVGYAMANPIEEELTFSLTHIYVTPDHWSNGIGRQLLNHIEQKIRHCGGERITLSVMADNNRAVRFYETTGYNRVSEFYDDRIDTHSYTYDKNI